MRLPALEDCSVSQLSDFSMAMLTADDEILRINNFLIAALDQPGAGADAAAYLDAWKRQIELILWRLDLTGFEVAKAAPEGGQAEDPARPKAIQSARFISEILIARVKMRDTLMEKIAALSTENPRDLINGWSTANNELSEFRRQVLASADIEPPQKRRLN